VPQREPMASREKVSLRRARWRRFMFVVLVVAGFYAAVTAAGDLTDAYGLLQHISIWWLGFAVVAVGFRFVVLGAQLSRLRGTAEVPGKRLGIGIALVAFGLGDLMPASPAEGFALSSAALRRRGMTPRQAWLMLASSQWVQFWALIMVFAVDRVVVAVSGELHRHHPWHVLVGSAILLAITAIAARMMRSPTTARRLSVLTRWLPSQHDKSAAQRSDDAVALHRDFHHTLGSPRNRLAVAWARRAVLTCRCHGALVHARRGPRPRLVRNRDHCVRCCRNSYLGTTPPERHRPDRNCSTRALTSLPSAHRDRTRSSSPVARDVAPPGHSRRRRLGDPTFTPCRSTRQRWGGCVSGLGAGMTILLRFMEPHSAIGRFS
jgi:hypothetical protein